jgi:hypothetical protein
VQTGSRGKDGPRSLERGRDIQSPVLSADYVLQ